MLPYIRILFASAVLLQLLPAVSWSSEKFGASLGKVTQSPALDRSVVEIQESLIWLDHYNGLVDGKLGPRTIAAIRSHQSSLGAEPTGTLTDADYAELVERAAQVRTQYGWAHFRHPVLGYKIAYPSVMLERSEPLFAGGRRFFSDHSPTELRIEIDLTPATDIGTLFSDLTKETAEREIIYSRLLSSWFVVTGKSQKIKFYTRVHMASGAFIGYTFVWPNDASGRFERVAIALSSSFEPPAKLSAMPRESTLTESIRDNSSDVDDTRETQAVPKPPTKGVPANPALTQTQLTPSELFAIASPSVWTLVATGSASNSDGSHDRRTGTAVAVSSDRLWTNCHTLEGMQDYFIGRRTEDAEKTIVRRVEVVTRNDKKDACVVKPVRHTLQRIVPTRASSSLRVGERVFSLGSPSGLELTLADGLLSGVRTIEGVTYVQNSAPISRGSSGGGLFDARGNLVGITTFYIRESQSLNFAIAVDEFPAP